MRRECDAEPVVGAGMVDIRLDEMVTNVRNTSSRHPGWGLNPPRFNTTEAVHLKKST